MNKQIRVHKINGETYLHAWDLVGYLEKSKFTPGSLAESVIKIITNRIRRWVEESK